MKHGINGPLWLGDFPQTRPCFTRISGHRWVMWLKERVGLTPDSGEKSCLDSGSSKKFSWSWMSSLFFFTFRTSCNTKDLAELGPCLALGIWCLLCLLQSSTLRLHTSSQRFLAGWPLRRSSSPGLCSATSSCAVTCSPSPANRLCYWLLSPQDNMLRISVSSLQPICYSF